MRSRSVRRFSRGKRDYIWCTSRIDQAIIDDEGLSISTLVSPSDWEASTTGFDRGTLVAIRGWLATSQAANGTTADQTMVAMYIAKNNSAAASAFSPLLASAYDSTDILWCSGTLIQSTAAGERGRLDTTLQLDIKAKRKISSSDVIQLVTAMDVDTVSPTFFVSGIVRCLVQRN